MNELSFPNKESFISLPKIFTRVFPEMNKFLPFLFAFVWVSTQAFCQQSNIDSMKTALWKLKEDTTKVKLLGTLSYACMYANPDEGIKYGKQGLELAKSLNWKKGIASANTSIGANYYCKSMFPEVMDCYFKALAIYEEIGDQNGVARSFSGIGIVYTTQKKYDKALEYCNNAVKMYEKLGYKKGIETNLSNMSMLYEYKINYTKALECGFKALNICNEIKDYNDLEGILGNIGNIYMNQLNYSKSLEFDFKALAISKKLSNQTGIATNLGNIGETYLTIAKDTSGKIKPDSLIPKGAKPNLDKAILYLKQSIDYCKKIGQFDAIVEFAPNLSEAYQLEGRYKEALVAYIQFTDYKDSVFSNQSKEKIAGLEAQRDRDIKDKQIQIEQLQLANKKIERVFYIAGLFALLLLIGIVFRNYIKQKKSNSVLQAQNAVIDARDKEKGLLLRELHHRVKNNLQIVSSLLNAQSLQLKDESAAQAIKEGKNRVEAMSFIHQRLYQRDNVTTINMKDYIQNLVNYISGSYGFDKSKLDLNIDVEDLELDADIAIPLGLIMNELISNSFKHAFKNIDKARLELALNKTDDNNLNIKISDNGSGIKENFDLETTKSFGMKMINLLIKQLRGKIIDQSANHSSFIFYIPLDKNLV